MEHQSRYIPAKTSEGWGIAAGVVFLAIVCAVSAAVIHRETYKHPTDVRWRAAGGQPAAEVPATH